MGFLRNDQGLEDTVDMQFGLLLAGLYACICTHTNTHTPPLLFVLSWNGCPLIYKNYLEGMRLPGFVLDDWFLSGGKEWPLLNLTGV